MCVYRVSIFARDKRSITCESSPVQSHEMLSVNLAFKDIKDLNYSPILKIRRFHIKYSGSLSSLQKIEYLPFLEIHYQQQSTETNEETEADPLLFTSFQ